jgi:hypothetical protein
MSRPTLLARLRDSSIAFSLTVQVLAGSTPVQGTLFIRR